MLLLFIAAYASIEFSGDFPKGSDSRSAMKALHFSFGLLVFFMAWLRLSMRLLSPTPHPEPTLPFWQRQAARRAHAALYALMIAMPLPGWLALNAAVALFHHYVRGDNTLRRMLPKRS